MPNDCPKHCNDKIKGIMEWKHDMVMPCGSMDKKANKEEVDKLLKWVSRIDNRMWITLFASLGALASATGTLLYMVLIA